MILLKRKPNRNIQIKILKDPDGEDLQRIQSLPDKQLKTTRSKDDRYDVWDHWEIPWEDISEITRRWQSDEYVAGEDIEDLLEQFERESIPTEDLPQFTGKIHTSKPLYPHQVPYVCTSKRRTRTLNSFDVGLGKSISSLERARRFPFTRMLILTPLVHLTGWFTEIVDAFNIIPVMYAGSPKQRQKIIENEIPTANFVIATYELFHEIQMDDFLFDSFIFDEAHLWSNPDSYLYRRMGPVLETTWDQPFSTCCQVLTATPAGNRITTLWPLLHAVAPTVAGSRKAFSANHEEIERTKIRVNVSMNPDGSLNKRIINRVTKANIINKEDLVAKFSAAAFRLVNDQIVSFKQTVKMTPVQMSEAQEDYYLQVKENLLDSLTKDKLGLRHAETKMLRLLQIAEGLFNLPEEEDNYESAKLDLIISRFRQLKKEGHKGILWSRFKRIGEIVHDVFPRSSVLYNGSQSHDMKTLAKWAFQGVTNQIDRTTYDRLAEKHNFHLKPGEAQFFLGIIDRRSSLGMNLQSCHYQIFSSFSFDSVAILQTGGRIIRLGQLNDTVTEFLLSADTWEIEALKYVLSLVQKNKEIFDGTDSLKKNQLIKLLKILEGGRSHRVANI